MEPVGKAYRIEIFSLSSPQMRAFHMTWLACFSVFFAWFAIAPLMLVVRADLGLSQEQIGNTIIASVAGTVVMRLLIGPLCEQWGARLTYSVLLVVGSFPVMAIGLSHSYESFLLFRLAIGAIGAAFVITQYHTSVMFASNCVGTANATTAGWGNLGGGVTQIVMPLIFAALLMLGVNEALGWRLAMLVPGVVMFLVGIGYFYLTQDAPGGNYRELRRDGRLPQASRGLGLRSLLESIRDTRVWALFIIYAACFGIELTINNVAALYFHDRFSLGLKAAGLVAGIFGLMNLFARTLGGYFSDRSAIKWGLKGRVWILFGFVFAEGLSLMLFSRASVLVTAIATLVIFSVLVKMAEGATFGLVPFVNRRAIGPVAGIVGAGGNAGAVAVGFLFRVESLSYQGIFFVLGGAIALVSVVALAVRFSPAELVRAESDGAVSAQDMEALGAATAEPVPALAKVG